MYDAGLGGKNANFDAIDDVTPPIAYNTEEDGGVNLEVCDVGSVHWLCGRRMEMEKGKEKKKGKESKGKEGEGVIVSVRALAVLCSRCNNDAIWFGKRYIHHSLILSMPSDNNIHLPILIF